MVNHVTDPKPIIEDATNPHVMRVLDDGPDQTIKSYLKNVFALGQLSKARNPDVVSAVHLPPGASSQNPSEYQWSLLSIEVVGVYLSLCLPGGDKPHALQSLSKH